MATALRAAAIGRPSAPSAFGDTAAHLFETLAAWRQRAMTRRELARLDERMIHDIGLSPADVEMEIAKPFWRA